MKRLVTLFCITLLKSNACKTSRTVRNYGKKLLLYVSQQNKMKFIIITVQYFLNLQQNIKTSNLDIIL